MTGVRRVMTGVVALGGDVTLSELARAVARIEQVVGDNACSMGGDIKHALNELRVRVDPQEAAKRISADPQTELLVHTALEVAGIEPGSGEWDRALRAVAVVSAWEEVERRVHGEALQCAVSGWEMVESASSPSAASMSATGGR